MDYNKAALELHEKYKGKIEVTSKVAVATKDDLSTAYTPGVAEPCREIARDKALVYKYTSKGNMVAVVTDGTAVLGLGDIGPEAALPVMEGKAVLFKAFANVDAFPICLATKDVEEIVQTVKFLEPVFGGINLEDIAAPRCFEIERRLKEELDIPVFHDDQHGTAIVVAAALLNSLKLAGKAMNEIQVVINGPGSAGIAIARLLNSLGVHNVILVGRKGALHKEADFLNPEQVLMMDCTNKYNEKGSLSEIIEGKDVFIGVSGPDSLTQEDVSRMHHHAIVFAMANPIPEIFPEEAFKGGAFIVGTGRSDFPNQVNNVLAFPGIFRGALDVRATEINEAMKVAAAYAIADTLSREELRPDYVIPLAFDQRTAPRVAEAVKKAARETGVARI